ncbi:MAG: hypothetical protein AAB425_00750 [Bdellovibrionota bacterium]
MIRNIKVSETAWTAPEFLIQDSYGSADRNRYAWPSEDCRVWDSTEALMGNMFAVAWLDGLR